MANVNIKFVIPVIMEEVTDRCLASYDLDWHDLILIDNSPESFCKKYEGKGAQIHYHPENLGVPKSWNIGLKECVDYIFILSSSMIFNRGFSEIVEKIKYANEYGLLTNQAWHCIGLGKRMIEEVGFFDEHFYPGYFEDNDYCYRLKLGKIHDIGEYCMPKVDLDVTQQGTALALRANKVQVNFDQLLVYYNQKWGGNPGEEKFKVPFNQGQE